MINRYATYSTHHNISYVILFFSVRIILLAYLPTLINRETWWMIFCIVAYVPVYFCELRIAKLRALKI